MKCIKILLVRVINSGVLFATDVTDVTDKLLVTNKIWLFKIALSLYPGDGSDMEPDGGGKKA